MYCLEHCTYTGHDCPKADSKAPKIFVCPLCARAVRFAHGQDPNVIFKEHESQVSRLSTGFLGSLLTISYQQLSFTVHYTVTGNLIMTFLVGLSAGLRSHKQCQGACKAEMPCAWLQKPADNHHFLLLQALPHDSVLAAPLSRGSLVHKQAWPRHKQAWPRYCYS